MKDKERQDLLDIYRDLRELKRGFEFDYQEVARSEALPYLHTSLGVHIDQLAEIMRRLVRLSGLP